MKILLRLCIVLLTAVFIFSLVCTHLIYIALLVIMLIVYMIAKPIQYIITGRNIAFSEHIEPLDNLYEGKYSLVAIVDKCINHLKDKLEVL